MPCSDREQGAACVGVSIEHKVISFERGRLGIIGRKGFLKRHFYEMIPAGKNHFNYIYSIWVAKAFFLIFKENNLRRVLYLILLFAINTFAFGQEKDDAKTDSLIARDISYKGPDGCQRIHNKKVLKRENNI
jgi:hypothetical protein